MTAEVLVEPPEPGPPFFAVDGLMDELCHVLSVARGTSVQRVYRREIGADGAEVACVHQARVTKPYTGSAVIDPRASGGHATKEFIEDSLPRVPSAARPVPSRERGIAGYLDARSEADYLEMRGVKAAVVVELLKAAYLDGLPPVPHEFCIEPKAFTGPLVKARTRSSARC